MTWTAVRTLTEQEAEAGVPDAEIFVGGGESAPRHELRLAEGVLDGAPSSVTLAVWRVSGGRVDKIGTWEIDAADIATPIPQLYELYDFRVYVTVASFSGGTTPKLSGVLEARPVFGG